MNRATSATLIALAVVVVLFVATWMTIPSGREETKNLTTGQWTTRQVGYPARLFRTGLRERERRCLVASRNPLEPEKCPGPEIVTLTVDLDALRSRVKVFYGGLAVVVVLVGLAFGAFRRRPM